MSEHPIGLIQSRIDILRSEAQRHRLVGESYADTAPTAAADYYAKAGAFAAGATALERASSLAPVAGAPDLQRTARFIYDTFVKSEVAGYRSRDRQFAIELLGHALGLPLHAPADVAARDRVAPPSGVQLPPDVVQMLSEPDLAVTVNPDGSCSPLPPATEPEAIRALIAKWRRPGMADASQGRIRARQTCADELEALVRASSAPPPVSPEQELK